MAMSIAGLTASTKYGDHRRGHFTAVNGGISFGGGQQVSYLEYTIIYLLLTNMYKKPSLMAYPRSLLSTFDDLRTHEDIKKIAHFQSGERYSTYVVRYMS